MNPMTVCPIKVGEILRMECVAMGSKGDGIFRVDGFVVMVPKAIEGMTYSFKVTRVLPKMGFGVLVDE
jgi:predicted RNA-binding protein with TRAM domain